MTSSLVKLRKGKKDFDWDKLVSPESTRLEIISPSLEEIPDHFDKVPNLMALEIHCPELKELPPTFFGLEKLVLLKIKNSTELNLAGDAKFRLLKTLQLAKLKTESLPNWLEHSEHIEVLDLHGNLLCDVPDYFKNFKALKRLNLDSNKFTTLPWELEELTSLTHLSVDGNSFDEDEKLRINRVFRISF
jgi:Leucine-rich repeat (LRR) protein